jgi:hypothetical protein
LAENGDKNKPKFNWVTERSQCSLPKVFKELALQVEEDVKTRNSLRPPNAPYEFAVAEKGTEVVVLLKTEGVQKAVVFSLGEHAIFVRDNIGTQMFEVNITFSDDGHCKLQVNEKECELWQVRRMALEDLLFHSN